MSVKEAVRAHLPRWFWLHSLLSRLKMLQYQKHVMPEDDIQDGEASWERKSELVSTYAAKWPEYARAVDAKIEELLEKSPTYAGVDDTILGRARVDMRFCRFAYGFQPDEYAMFELRDKTMAERRAFVSDVERNRYLCRMNDIVDFTVFMDKWATYQHYAADFHRRAVPIASEEDWPAFERLAATNARLVAKRVDLSKGDSVRMIETCDGASTRACFEEMLADGKHIVEELIEQSDEMASFNPSSVNTIRIITFYTNSGVETPFCFLKCGRNGSFVDNGGAGGLLIGIESKTGVLGTNAYDEYGAMYESHPDTGVRFLGAQLPDWQGALDLARRLSAEMPSVAYIGWDFAHTKDGWIVVEGNSCSQMIVPQGTWKRGIKAEVEELLSRMKLYA